MVLKFCGLRRPEDITFANQVRPDYIGFVFAESRRQVTVPQAVQLAGMLDPAIKTVGVFVNEPMDSLCSTVQQAGLDVIQLHGDESVEVIQQLRDIFPDREIWKAVRVRDTGSLQEADCLPADVLLLDSFVPGSYGGSGQTANWSLIARAGLQKPFFLAGGLDAGNIAQAALAVHPYGIDVSGGIETDGKKDISKMKAVKDAVRRAAFEKSEIEGDTHE